MAKGKKTGGRTAGTPNKNTTEVALLAQQYTAEAVERLAHWMRQDNAKASVSAASALLDRGHGKPSQSIDIDAAVTNYAAQPIPVEQRHTDTVARTNGAAANGHSAR